MSEIDGATIAIVFLIAASVTLCVVMLWSRGVPGIYTPSLSLPPPPPLHKMLHKFPIQVTLFDVEGNSIKCPTVWIEVKDDAGKNGDHVAAIENNAKMRLFSSAKCKIDWSEHRKRYSSI